MFSAGQTATTTTTEPTQPQPQTVLGWAGAYGDGQVPHNTQDYITKLMCNRDALDDEEYAPCVDTLTSGYTTNRNIVPESLRAAFDSVVEMVTNLIFTDCTAMEMRTRQSASARNRMCIPVAEETCETDRPAPSVAQCTYQAVMGERITLLETSEPVAILGALFSYIGFFAAFAQLLGTSQEGSSDTAPPTNGDCTPAGGCRCDDARATVRCEENRGEETAPPPPPPPPPRDAGTRPVDAGPPPNRCTPAEGCHCDDARSTVRCEQSRG